MYLDTDFPIYNEDQMRHIIESDIEKGRLGLFPAKVDNFKFGIAPTPGMYYDISIHPLR